MAKRVTKKRKSSPTRNSGSKSAATMLPRERADYSAIVDRPPLKLPSGARIIFWTIVNLEVWDIGKPMARQVLAPPTGETHLPDVPNWSWHEYGMRVGFWRLRKVFKELGISPTCTLNARVCETYPAVVKTCIDDGWELNAHGYDQVPMHEADDQRGVIMKSMDIIEKFSGKRPRGWFGPGLTQTFDTLDYLSEAGVEYIGDWVLDDEPVTLKTTHKPVVALPYNFEIHDIVLMALQHHTSDIMYVRAKDQFDWLYAEAVERPKVMAIACHPYLSGVPHRIGHVKRTFEELLARDGVVAWSGDKILDWYLAQRQ